MLIHILCLKAHVLTFASLDDTEDANYGNNSHNDYEAKNEVSALFIDGAGSLLNDDSLHLCDNLTGFIYSHHFFGAICLGHDFGCR